MARKDERTEEPWVKETRIDLPGYRVSRDFDQNDWIRKMTAKEAVRIERKQSIHVRIERKQSIHAEGPHARDMRSRGRLKWRRSRPGAQAIPCHR